MWDRRRRGAESFAGRVHSRAYRPAGGADCGYVAVYGGPGVAAAPGLASYTIGDAYGTIPAMVRGGEPCAEQHTGQPRPAKPARVIGSGRLGRQHGVGR